MKLINADHLRSLITDFPSWNIFDKDRAIRMIDEAPTIAYTDRPLAIINDKVIYLTDGHVKTLLKYEEETAIREARDRIINNLNEIHEWENNNG